MREIQMQQPAATAGGDWHTGRQVRRHTDREASQDILTERQEKLTGSSYRDRNGGEKGLSSEEWKVCKQ